MRVLLVNPWIIDVAAFNFWLRPLGLYELATWLSARGAEVKLLDCLSPARAPGKFTKQPFRKVSPPGQAPVGLNRYGISPEEFNDRLCKAGRFDAVLVTSAISYWYHGVLDAIEKVRRHSPGAPIILGGVYPTLWPSHASRHSGADLVLPGSVEQCGPALAGFLGMPAAPLDPWQPWWRLNLHDGAAYGAIRTARGCPYACTYCASSLLSGGFKPRVAGEVEEELLALNRLGVREVAFYDDALLVGGEERVFRAIDRARERGASLAFQTPNGLHARLLDGKTARRMVECGFVGFKIALETLDGETMARTGPKADGDDAARAVGALLGAGVGADAIGVYLLMGLPGQKPEEVAESIRFVRSLGVRPHLSEYSPIPSTVDWERARAAGLVREEMDPLLTNNSLYLTRIAGWDGETVRGLKRLARGVD